MKSKLSSRHAVCFLLLSSGSMKQRLKIEDRNQDSRAEAVLILTSDSCPLTLDFYR